MAKEQLIPLIVSEMDRGGIIHVANIKGGVGKSTLVTNLAAAIAKRGRVLIIDLDVQGSAGTALGIEEPDIAHTSWDFFKRRFASELSVSRYAELLDISGLLSKIQEMAIGKVVGGGNVDDAVVKVSANLHIAPAGLGLFNSPAGFQYGNFLHNLGIVKRRYKYVIIDTPSVWNRLARFLYVNSDLNLIPVTLDALSTKSFKEYLVNIKRLMSHNPHVRLRIVKNEVSRDDDKQNDNTRTIDRNRRYLNSLCEQAAAHNDIDASLPRSIMFDLEIPESSAIRAAQDMGKTIYDYGGDSVAAKAFDLLAQNVQNVLNGINRENITASALEAKIVLAFKMCAVLLLIVIIAMNKPIFEIAPPRPIAPQQVMESAASSAIVHTFAKGDNIARFAKYAICAFRAVVPTQREINNYIIETLNAHNMTKDPSEPTITDHHRILAGTRITFYPPLSITNKQEKSMVQAYRFFMDMVDDPYPYVTGDWCERGTAGNQVHYAIDVAGAYGSEVFCPVDGIATIKTESIGGRTVAVKFNDAVIFFSHLEKRYVNDGDTVSAGSPIGTIGMTGRTSGPHVHIGYGLKSLSRHDVTFNKESYRLTDPKHLFYAMAFRESVDR